MVGRQGAVEGPVLRSNQTGEGGRHGGGKTVRTLCPCLADVPRDSQNVTRCRVQFHNGQTNSGSRYQSLIKPDLQAPACRFTKPIQVPKIQWSTIIRQGGDSHERWHLSSGPPPTGRDDASALANRTCFGHEPQTRASAVPTKKETPLVLGDRGKSG